MGALILLALLAALLCARAGSVLGALVFVTVALLIFVNTPAGAGLPAGIGSFFDSVNKATAPALNQGAAT